MAALFASDIIVNHQGSDLRRDCDNASKMATMLITCAIAERLIRQLRVHLALADSLVRAGQRAGEL